MEKEKFYCRRCQRHLSDDNFYRAMDGGLVDTSGRFSVCKSCIQNLYDLIYNETGSMEKTINRLCRILNIKFTNEALDAAKAHITTLLESGKNANVIFGIYIMKLIATKKSMDKAGVNDFQYEDIGTIFVEKQIDVKEIPVPQEVKDFWGKEFSKEDLEFLETQYANFKQTHRADLFAEVVLLKEICYAMLRIKHLRIAKDPDLADAITGLRMLMKESALTPKEAKAGNQNSGVDAFGLWVLDIERFEPAEWLKNDPRGDAYRDVNNVDDYYQKYIVRPIKNFITQSKDFNIEEENVEDSDYSLDDDEINNIISVDDE